MQTPEEVLARHAQAMAIRRAQDAHFRKIVREDAKRARQPARGVSAAPGPVDPDADADDDANTLGSQPPLVYQDDASDKADMSSVSEVAPPNPPPPNVGLKDLQKSDRSTMSSWPAGSVA